MRKTEVDDQIKAKSISLLHARILKVSSRWRKDHRDFWELFLQRFLNIVVVGAATDIRNSNLSVENLDGD